MEMSQFRFLFLVRQKGKKIREAKLIEELTKKGDEQNKETPSKKMKVDETLASPTDEKIETQQKGVIYDYDTSYDNFDSIFCFFFSFRSKIHNKSSFTWINFRKRAIA